MAIKTALISVSDKRGIIEFARALVDLGIQIISTGGTAQILKKAAVPVQEISDVTGFPEMMDGRVKTLHPKIHGAILADRTKKKHIEEAKRHKIGGIDLVAVNLYPFENTIKKTSRLESAIENIDIGGPALLRSAAKNYAHVAAVVNPERYDEIAREIKERKGELTQKTKELLALEVWEHVAHYDAVIAQYFRKKFMRDAGFPKTLTVSFRKMQDLRYGENPHQQAALYKDDQFEGPAVINAEQLQGKQLSYNNILDASAALELCKEFDGPTVVIVKHNNPSGVASSENIVDAYKLARSVDPEAAFGGVVAVNRAVDETLAKEITSVFVEIVVAPSFTQEARRVFEKRKNLRLLQMPDFGAKRLSHRTYRSIPGGILVQDADTLLLGEQLKVVTKRKPTEEEMDAMAYAWKIAKYVKSNAIVYARNNRAIAIGAGQMKRVDAAKLAVMIARDYYGEGSIKGCSMASDAFFPFRDGIDYAAKLGVTAIIQPGGSIHDQEVIDAANEHNIAMLFTGIRHFRH